MHPGLTRRTGLLGMATLDGACVSLLVLHFLAARSGHMPRYLSHFVDGPHGWLWVMILIMFAGAILMILVALHDRLPRGHLGGAARAAMAIASVSILGVALFPPSPPGAIARTFVEWVHEIFAITAFLSLTVSMVLMAVCLRGRARWFSILTIALALGVIGILPWSLHGYLLGTEAVRYSERILVILQGCWLLALSGWARAPAVAPVP